MFACAVQCMFGQLGQKEGERKNKKLNIVSRKDVGEKQKERKKKNRSKNDYESGQFGRHENGDRLKHTLFYPRDFFCKLLFHTFVMKLVEINQSLHLFSFSRFPRHLSFYIYRCIFYHDHVIFIWRFTHLDLCMLDSFIDRNRMEKRS
jgi:hypothetical protein